MIRDILSFWIICQLIIIGLSGAGIRNEMIDGTYKCKEIQEETKSVLVPALLPLVFFVEDQYESDYCKN